MSGTVIILGILITLILIIPPVYGQEEITISKSQNDNQTVTNVYVTIENGFQGSAMVTSAIILGFIGFSSALEFTRFTQDRKDQRKMIVIISVAIIVVLIIQFYIIIEAYNDNLDTNTYTYLMVITLIIFVLLLMLLNIQSGWYTKQREKEHEQKARFHEILDKTSKNAIR